MATYVPGYQRYEREFEPFTPDFKFLSEVMSVRQDRYNTNYKQMNDLYGKIVYSDLSRKDTQETRDQYVNKLIPKIQKASGMDLSIQANVDAAQSLFTPFYDDDLIVRDMVNTSAYKSAMQVASSYKDSDDAETRKKYWGSGIEALSYQMEDFVNADANKAVNMAPPRYVPNADLYNVAQEYLAKQNYKMQWVSGTGANEKFVIVGENGERLIPTAYADLQRAMREDPRITDAYRTDAYVQSRRYAQQGIEAGKYASIDEGRNAWAQNTITELRDRASQANPMLQKQYEDALSSKSSWEEYASKQGVVLSESEKKSMELSGAEYEETLLSIKNNNEQLERIDAMDENSDAINLVSSLLMSYNISSDLFAAAKNYSLSHGGVKSVTDNVYTKMSIQHDYNKKLEEYKVKLADIKETNDGNEAAAYMASLAGLEAPSTQATVVNQEAVSDWLTAQNKVKVKQQDDLRVSKVDFIKKMYQLTSDKSKVSTDLAAIDLLVKRGDGKTIDYTFNQLVKKYDDIVGTSKNDSKHPAKLLAGAYVPAAEAIQSIKMKEAMMLNEHSLYGKTLDRTLELLKASGDGAGKTINTLLKQGAPAPLVNGKFLSEKEYAIKFTEAIRAGKIKDNNGKVLDPSLANQMISMNINNSGGNSGTFMGTGQVFSNNNKKGESTTRGNYLAKIAYNKYRDTFNAALSGKLDSGGADIYPNYSTESFYRGVNPNDMTPGNLYVNRSYNASWNASTMIKDDNTRMLFSDAIKQFTQTPRDQIITMAGKVPDKIDDTKIYNDETASSMITELFNKAKGVIMDKVADGKISQENQNFVFDIKYDQTRNINGKSYAAYTFTVPKSFTDDYKLKDVASGSGTVSEKDLDAYQSFSFLVDADKDISQRNASQYNSSFVEQEINLSEKKMMEYNDFGKFGGSLQVYKNDGIYYSAYTQAYKDKNGALAYREADFQPVIGDNGEFITKNNIDSWVGNQMAILKVWHLQNAPKN